MRILGRDFPELMSALAENMSEGVQGAPAAREQVPGGAAGSGGSKSCSAEWSVNARFSRGLGRNWGATTGLQRKSGVVCLRYNESSFMARE